VVVCQLQVLRARRGAWRVGFVVCAVALLYVHYAGLVLIAALAVMSAALWWRGANRTVLAR
jgi:hypothetical protein